MNSSFVPDRYNDCGDDIGYYEEKKKCVGCGEYHDGEERYCDSCINIMLNDYHYLSFYAYEIEADGNVDLNEIKEWAKENLDEFFESCEKYDKLGV